jgi:chemotaxis protein MotB
MKKFLFFITIASAVVSCIPARQVEEIKSKYERCDTERQALSNEKMTLETTNTELQAQIAKTASEIKILRRDTTNTGASLNKMTAQYDKINRLNDELLKKSSELKEGSESENKKLVTELQLLQEDLQRREDELKDAEKELEQAQRDLEMKKLKLERLSLDLERSAIELRKREQRVNELEAMIAQKDAAAKALKDKVAEALLGFKDKGLTVEQKNGKIYVSMEAKLLFASGSTKVDPEGKKALVELAKVLQDQKDLGILVEGHTDIDKLSGTGVIKDNWDLSVMRATSVVRIMLESNTIGTEQITAAGRGEFMPIDAADTPEAKAKNRRIEVILTPNLDKLFELIEQDSKETKKTDE